MNKQLCLQILVTVTDDFDLQNFNSSNVIEKMFLTENYEAFLYYDTIIKNSITKKYKKLGFYNISEDSIFRMGSYFSRMSEPIKFTVKKEEYLVEEDQELEISSVVLYTLKDIPKLFYSLENYSFKIEDVINKCFAKRATESFDISQTLSNNVEIDLTNCESV